MIEKQKGLKRLIAAARNSAKGFRTCFETEEAFRQEVALAVILTPLAFWMGDNRGEILWLITAIFLVLSAELANTAIERVVDRISTDLHPLSGDAKDIGSALVMLSLGFFVFVWSMVIFF